MKVGTRVVVNGSCQDTGHSFHHANGSIAEQAQNGENRLWAVHIDGSRQSWYLFYDSQITVVES